MKLAFWVARRYIFSKKSTNAINIISGISVFGISLGSMALVVIMSVFNGFEEVLRDLISAFKPDIQVTVKEGKTFTLDSTTLAQLRQTDGVSFVSTTLEEVALFEYGKAQSLARIKGVDDYFPEIIRMDTILETGRYRTYDAATDVNFAVVGVALQSSLDVSPDRADNQPLVVYMPKREAKKLSGSKPFRQRELYPTAVYSVDQVEFDNHVITNIDFVRQLLAYENGEMSALEIKLKPDASPEKVKAALYQFLPADKFSIKDRYEQDEAFFKVTNMEKWVGFIIFSFTLVLVAFNMVGALWMLVLEKQKDISTLKALGATNALVRNIFLAEGAMLSIFGVLLGCLLGFGLCILQQQTGFIKLDTGSAGSAFVIDYYPVALRISDFIIVIFTVLGIGTLAAWLPAARATRVDGIVRNQ
jgi:lipoprotein-releasing system permease protein